MQFVDIEKYWFNYARVWFAEGIECVLNWHS
ncbi:Uncharacterised protein [Enterobacter hormaechei]|nr:Uncharacterised protein [Enterobacter hormaechei]